MSVLPVGKQVWQVYFFVFPSYRADNGSSSKYSFKIDKNKENQTGKKRVTHFPNVENATV